MESLAIKFKGRAICKTPSKRQQYEYDNIYLKTFFKLNLPLLDIITQRFEITFFKYINKLNQ